MKLLRGKFIFGGVVMLSLQLSLVFALHAQSDKQATNNKNAGRAICHFTGDLRSPYELVTVRAGSRHAGHDGDVKAENGTCPSMVPANWSGAARDGQVGRSGTAARESGMETSPLSQSNGKNVEIKPADTEKNVAICHKEGDGNYHLNSVSENAVAAHLGHGDIYPENGGCLSGSGTGDGEAGATPEPVTMLLFGAGLAGIGYVSRRRMANRAGRPD